MIAVDTSTLVAFLAGDKGRDVETLDAAFAANQAHLPPVVLTEVLSAPDVPDHVGRLVRALPILEIADGYWERAGRTRGRVLSHGLKAPLADALICQSCLDYRIALVTRDADFKPFALYCGLDLR